MSIFYTYILKHIKTGQIYIGFRKSSMINPYDDLGVKYFTSSKTVKQLGFENFFYSVIDIYNDAEICFWEEQRLIKEIFNSGVCLNKQYHDKETSKRIWMNLGTDSDETRLKKSIAQKKLGRLVGVKQGLGNKSRTGMKIKPETSQKMSSARLGNKNALGSPSHTKNKGRKYYHDPVTKRRKMFDPEDSIPDGWLPGMGTKTISQ